VSLVPLYIIRNHMTKLKNWLWWVYLRQHKV